MPFQHTLFKSNLGLFFLNFDKPKNSNRKKEEKGKNGEIDGFESSRGAAGHAQGGTQDI